MCVCALASVRQGVREYVYVCVRVSRPTSVCVRVCVWWGESVFRRTRADEYVILATMLADTVTRKPPVTE